jgi:hypothetical protein
VIVAAALASRWTLRCRRGGPRVPVERFGMLLRAPAEVIKDGPAVEALIIGEGCERPALLQVAEISSQLDRRWALRELERTA